MQCYLISFDDRSMKIPEADLPAVSDAARAAVREAKSTRAWLFGGGQLTQQASIVTPDGSVTCGPYPQTKPVLGGFSILEVPTRDEALG